MGRREENEETNRGIAVIKISGCENDQRGWLWGRRTHV